MIQMFVSAIAVDKESGEPIVLLNDRDKKRSLPIWIGAAEARAITFAVQKISTPRPLTHDLLHSVIKRLGYAVKESRINELNNRTYKASIVLARGNSKIHKNTILLDARPSDAIALSAIAGAPLMVADEVFVYQKNLATDSEQERKEKEKFKEFLEGINASDFRLPNSSNLDESNSDGITPDEAGESE